MITLELLLIIITIILILIMIMMIILIRRAYEIRESLATFESERVPHPKRCSRPWSPAMYITTVYLHSNIVI